ncbi:MerR family transcriptional regulator [Pseudonocardia xinjiangensis]|uniref:MerR family transcriptional regulator n=1 Tax=Pseudonocardia xinjiangensis TaxID=75289 RepID=A0ABX1RIX5_9PSEU|nr:MerR family transcriptional regulator [Pseudonocardia xinjiangensis]NMH79399.1 MerR family transcriptional regulator [Pseudonocardia xinjiangensis]
MELLTIGTFARVARLSPKALRLYDELGLLRPARVDASSGYRYYSPDQLDRARLVAWLRRLGMPLAGIAKVVALPPDAAAAEVRAYWRQVEIETSTRRALASDLVDHLSGKDTTMTAENTLTLRYSMACDRGLVRQANQDAVHADAGLLAVADGFGPADAPSASAAAVGALAQVDVSAGAVLNALDDAISDAAAAVRAVGPEAGTTLTALVRSGSRLALVHVGDSRAYLVRDGVTHRITSDHTLVQTMVEDGRLTPAEAASHPQRALLVRALHADGRPDVELREARSGDRYLLCTDGVHAVLSEDVLHEAMREAEPDAVVTRIVEHAHALGAPDNLACVVADVVGTT